MCITDIILIGLSAISCVLSFIAVCLVHRGIEKNREIEADKLAREKSRIELQEKGFKQILDAVEAMEGANSSEIIQVPVQRIMQKRVGKRLQTRKTGVA